MFRIKTKVTHHTFNRGDIEMPSNRLHTTIGLRKVTKAQLNKNRALGQCYDGFICQLIDLWERHQPGNPLCASSESGRSTMKNEKKIA